MDENKIMQMKQFYYGLGYRDSLLAIPDLTKNKIRVSTITSAKKRMKIRLAKWKVIEKVLQKILMSGTD